MIKSPKVEIVISPISNLPLKNNLLITCDGKCKTINDRKINFIKIIIFRVMTPVNEHL